MNELRAYLIASKENKSIAIDLIRDSLKTLSDPIGRSMTRVEAEAMLTGILLPGASPRNLWDPQPLEEVRR